MNKTSTTPAKTLELWVSKPARETASSTPLPPTPFDTQASALTRRLMDDFGFKDFQAAAIVGNIGYETGGFRILQEVRPLVGRGGLGYLQWSGPKRVNFENFCQQKGLSPTSPEANYGFLKQELETTEASAVSAVKATNSLEDATQVFMARVIRPAVTDIDMRKQWARKALDAVKSS